MSKNLMIIGPGHLGCRVAILWKQAFPDAQVYLKARSNQEERNKKWEGLGYIPLSEEKDDVDVKCPYVVFAAPPTGNPNYAKDLKRHVSKHWDSSTTGSSVFTSSAGIYVENNGGPVDESSEVQSGEARNSFQIYEAEAAMTELGGTNLRLGGLYTTSRGPHNFWLGSGKPEFPSKPNGLINMIHYDDAARAVFKILVNNVRKELFLLSDGVPISRIQICEATKAHPKFKDAKIPVFAGGDDVDGKRYNTEKFKKTFDWEPELGTYKDVFATNYDKEMAVPLME